LRVHPIDRSRLLMKHTWLWSLLIGALILAAKPASVQDAARVSIYVGAQVRDGFIDMDAGIRDSIRDIQQECSTAGLTVVADPDEAQIRLFVLGRGLPVKGEVGVSSGSAIGGIGFAFGIMVPNTVPTITTTLRVGQYERTNSREGGTWRNAAKNVVDDL